MREAVNTTKITAWKLSGRTTCTNSLSPGSTDFLQHGAMLATPLTSSLWLPAVLQSPWHTYTVGLQLPLYEPSTGFNIFQMTDLRFWLHVCLVFKICVIYAQLCIMCRFAYVCIVCTHTRALIQISMEMIMHMGKVQLRVPQHHQRFFILLAVVAASTMKGINKELTELCLLSLCVLLSFLPTNTKMFYVI